MLQLLESFGLYLPYPLAGYAHHLTDFLKRKRPIIAGNPCAVQESFILKPPFTGRILAGF